MLPAGLDAGTSLEPSRALNRYQNYMVDTAIPLHRITFNGVVDLPAGRGKRFLQNSNRLVDALLGGYQVAFVGTVVSQSFAVASTNWGATSPIQRYESSVPVTDCRSGVCRPAYMWFNGYLSPTQINTANGVQGLPADYTPYLAPINNTPGAPNFGNNNVLVTLSDGRQVLTPFLPGPGTGAHPYGHTVLQGPINHRADISLYKIFTITERVRLRFNLDAFNAFNIQGLVSPNSSDGIQSLQTSYWTPRQIQFTLRLSF